MWSHENGTQSSYTSTEAQHNPLDRHQTANTQMLDPLIIICEINKNVELAPWNMNEPLNPDLHLLHNAYRCLLQCHHVCKQQQLIRGVFAHQWSTVRRQANNITHHMTQLELQPCCCMPPSTSAVWSTCFLPDSHEVTVTLTFDLQDVICSSMRQRECLFLLWKDSMEVSLGYCAHKV